MNSLRQQERAVEDVEFKLLLEGVYERYGFDFREYAPASLKRRIYKHAQDEKLTTISGVLDSILHNTSSMERLLRTLSVDVTSMFRDPSFFLALRANLFPILKTEPLVRIWVAGCASGEEVYSVAIALQEEGLLEKSRIYATDMNSSLLDEANAGVYSMAAMREFTDNYIKAGGKKSFSEYYTAKYDNAIMNASLKRNLVWANHNLATDASFNEFHLILCRNVMIYFNASLQERVHQLLYDSLPFGGFLGLGSKESLSLTNLESQYDVVDEKEKLYRKNR